MSENQTKSGVICIIENEIGKVRISKSRSPFHQIQTVQSEGGFKTENIFVSEKVSDYCEAELDLHNQFRECRYIGDWFDIDFNEAVEACKKITAIPSLGPT